MEFTSHSGMQETVLPGAEDREYAPGNRIDFLFGGCGS